jgi:hypothetical protein
MCSGMSADLQNRPLLLIPILGPGPPRTQACEANSAYPSGALARLQRERTAEQIRVQEQNEGGWNA